MKTLLLYWRPILAAAVLLYLAIAAIGAVHNYGQRQYQAGRNAVLAADAAAATQARQKADQHAANAAAAAVAMHGTLEVELPHIEVAAHAAVDKIQTIYLAAPAGPDTVCVRPPGVQAELDAARDRANAAARGQL